MSGFWELLHNGSFIFWGAIVLISTVPVIARYWHLNQKLKHDTELKQGMIARGMSADEIERVLSSKSTEQTDCGDHKPPKK